MKRDILSKKEVQQKLHKIEILLVMCKEAACDLDDHSIGGQQSRGTIYNLMPEIRKIASEVRKGMR